MLNTPVYQRIKLASAEGDEKIALVRLAYLREKFAVAEERVDSAKDAIRHANSFINKTVNELDKLTQNLHDDIPKPTDALKEMKDGYLGKLEQYKNKVTGDSVRAQLSLGKLEKAIEDITISRTESFGLEYHHMKFGRSVDGWKSQDDFYDFIDEMVDEFNKEQGREVLVARGYNGSATVHFLFPKSHLAEVEAFIPKMANTIRKDYEDNYLAVTFQDSNYAEQSRKNDSTEAPFDLHGTSGGNLFHFYSRHDLADLSRDELLNEAKSHYNAPSCGERLLDYQSLQTHFILPVDDELSQEIKEWKGKAFGGVVNGQQLDKSREGFEKLARITQQRVLEINPELTSKFEKEDLERTQASQAFVYE